MAQQKRDGNCTRLVVTGCLAERYRDELKKEIPEIDAVLGTGEVPIRSSAQSAREASAASREQCSGATDVLIPIRPRQPQSRHLTAPHAHSRPTSTTPTRRGC